MPRTIIYNKIFICQGAIGGMELDYALPPEGMIDGVNLDWYDYGARMYELKIQPNSTRFFNFYAVTPSEFQWNSLFTII